MSGTMKKYTPNYYYNKVVDIVGHESTRHVHKEFEIYYMKEGSCTYYIEDLYVGLKNDNSSLGDFVNISGGYNFFLANTSDTNRTKVVSFGIISLITGMIALVMLKKKKEY